MRDAGSRRPVRLTRQGRLVVQLAGWCLLAALVAIGFGVAPSAGVAAPEAGGGSSHVVVVQPGDSLWSVAVRHDPDGDPSETVEEIRRINHLSGYTVHPGQRLKLP